MSNVGTVEDAALVGRALGGNRDAFGQLVSRYQSSVCGLAYSACGNISQSEDLAQETFIMAWRKLDELKEPAKFKSWLYGIARNLVHNAFRKETRNPLAASEPLEETLAATPAASDPAQHAITKEEEASLWRSLDQIPETYREALVMFYREHHSIERVAEILDLTEEAARQRLSRGRKLLQERILAFVEGALEQTAPGPAFTLNVLAALPAISLSATVSAAAKSGAVAKGAGLLGLFGAIITPVFALFGMLVDYRIRKRAGLAGSMLKPLKGYYVMIAISVVVFVSAACILVQRGAVLAKTSPAAFVVLMLTLIAGYPLVIGIFARRLNRALKQAAVGETVVGTVAGNFGSAWEYRSPFEFLGLPFIHIRFGGQIGWQGKLTKGWIAIGDSCSFGGLFAYGGLAVAPVSIGGCAIGLLSYGAMAIGALVWGGFGIGAWAFGAFAFGWQAFSGGCAIAWHLAWGHEYAMAHDYALGSGTVFAAQANTPFVEELVKSSWGHAVALTLSPYFYWLMWVWAIPMMIAMIARWIRSLQKISAEKRN